MGGVIRPRYRSEEADASVEPYGQLARFLLEGRNRQEPKLILLMHAAATAQERGEESGPALTAVWLRVLWPTDEESLGFVSCADSELIWALYPDRCQWLSRLIGGPFDPDRKAHRSV